MEAEIVKTPSMELVSELMNSKVTKKWPSKFVQFSRTAIVLAMSWMSAESVVGQEYSKELVIAKEMSWMWWARVVVTAFRMSTTTGSVTWKN